MKSLFVVEDIKFVKNLEDIKVTETGVTVTFECELSKTGLKVEWLKDDKPLRATDHLVMTTDGGIHRLTINKVDSEDIGKYKATYKKLSTQAKLSVEGNSYNILNIV